MKSANYVLVRIGFCAALLANAQESVRFEATVDGLNRAVEAVYTKSSLPTRGKSAAVVLMHSAGGSRDGTTGPLAKALNASGIASLEIQLFVNPFTRPMVEKTPTVDFEALKYLNGKAEIDGDRIGIAGCSYGGLASLWTATKWMTESYDAGLKFAAHAPI